jgi:hypothetical protein
MNFIRGLKKGASSKKESSAGGNEVSIKQNEVAPPVVKEVEEEKEEKKEPTPVGELPKYVCICTNGSSYKSEPAFHSANVGMIRAFGRVQPLRMLDDKGRPTDHHEKFAWMEVKFENEKVFLPIHTIDGDILFQPHEPTYGSKSETMKSFEKKKNEVTPQISENEHENDKEDDGDDDDDDDNSSASSDDSASTASEDEERKSVPRGEDLGLSGGELYGYVSVSLSLI